MQERQKKIDDRESRHARRALRGDLQAELTARSTDFHLTQGTVRKRRATHALYACFLILLVSFFTFELVTGAKDASGYVRLGLTAAAIGAIFILYIRWSDQWFRQHADEEFRLKRLSLDVDRASWVVETALEWQQQNQSPIPSQLLEQLSKGLFGGGPTSSAVRHPAEDLAAAVLSASSVKLNLPGVGEAMLTRKDVQKFKEAVNEDRGSA